MTGCFDFRLRASPSVDLDRIQGDHDASKFSMSFSKLFRSRSDGSVKTARSQSEGPTVRSTRSRPLSTPSPVTTASAAGNRRRYVRVVRSDDARDTRRPTLGDSAHVIIRSRSYSSTDRRRLKKSASADAEVATGSKEAQQMPRVTSSPYTPSSGHTILKKHNHSLDAGSGTVDGGGVPAEVSPPNSKHASFREEVEILEYDTHGKALLVKCVTHTKKLNYEEEDEEDEDDSLNIDESFDDDLESTDFSLKEIQDETTSTSATVPSTALTPSLASCISKLSMEADEAAKPTTLDQHLARDCPQYSADSQTSSLAADYALSAFHGKKGLSGGTPSATLRNTVVISDQSTYEGFRSSMTSGGAIDIVKSCHVADEHQLIISKSCSENDRGFSTTPISCPGSSSGSLYTSDSCPENRYCPNLKSDSIPEHYQDLKSACKYSPALNPNLSGHPCPANTSAALSTCPSISTSSCIQSSIGNKSSSTNLCQPTTVQLAETQQSQPDHTLDFHALVKSIAF